MHSEECLLGDSKSSWWLTITTSSPSRVNSSRWRLVHGLSVYWYKKCLWITYVTNNCFQVLQVLNRQTNLHSIEGRQSIKKTKFRESYMVTTAREKISKRDKEWWGRRHLRSLTSKLHGGSLLHQSFHVLLLQTPSYGTLFWLSN